MNGEASRADQASRRRRIPAGMLLIATANRSAV